MLTSVCQTLNKLMSTESTRLSTCITVHSMFISIITDINGHYRLLTFMNICSHLLMSNVSYVYLLKRISVYQRVTYMKLVDDICLESLAQSAPERYHIMNPSKMSTLLASSRTKQEKADSHLEGDCCNRPQQLHPKNDLTSAEVSHATENLEEGTQLANYAATFKAFFLFCYITKSKSQTKTKTLG